LQNLSRTRERLDRKTLKHDPLMDFIGKAGDYVGANANRVLSIAAGVVVVIVLAVLWTRGQSQKGSESDLRLAQVVAAFSNLQYEPAIELATSMQSNFPGTRAAVLSKYIAGKAQMQLGKFPEAEQSFRGYMAEASKDPFYENSVRSSLAASLEAQGKYAEAASMYQEASGKLTEPLASQAKLDAARALRLAGSYEEAKKLLQPLTEDRTSPLSQKARIELAVLESSNRAPAMVAPTPTP
jgi:tetratricopeptide (TPR) repeat protein